MGELMELTPEEKQVVLKMRMTPEERHAEAMSRLQEHLNSLPPEMRQAAQDRQARIDAMNESQRIAYSAGERLARCAWMLQRDVQRGMVLSEALAAVEPSSQADVAWLISQLKAME